MEFRILGPLEVVRAGNALPLAGARPRALLALLLLHANEVVSADRLIDALWGEDPPQNAANALQTTASRLRKHLGQAGLVRTRPPGYVIEVGDDALDLARFERLTDTGRAALAAGEPEAASALLEEALGLWHGPALADLAREGYLQREAARLEEERLTALELRLEADLACGRHVARVGELEALVQEHPFREGLRGQLMVALYRSGRQAEALEAYQGARRRLVEELGIEPSRALQQLERAILVQDPALELPKRVPERGAAAAAPAIHRPPRRVGRPRWLAAGLAVLVASIGATAAAVALVRRDPPGLTRLVPNSLGVIDPETNRIVGQVRVGQLPARIAVSEDAIWVMNAADRTVSRVDPGRRDLVRTISVTGSAELTGLAVSREAVWLGSGLDGPLVLSRIDPGLNEIAQRIPLGRAEEPFFAARWQVAVGGGSVWAAGGRFGTLARLDPRTGRVVSSIAVGVKPVAIAAGRKDIWVAGGPNVVVRVDARTGSVVDRVTVPIGPWTIAVGAGAVWVTAAREDVVARLDPVTATVTTIGVGDLPTAVAVAEGSVWVANAGDGTVSRIDPEAREVVATIDLGASPEAIAAGAGVIWVAVSAGLGAERGR